MNMGVYTLMLPPSQSGEIKDPRREKGERGTEEQEIRGRGNVKGRKGKRIKKSREEERLGREKVGKRKGTGRKRWKRKGVKRLERGKGKGWKEERGKVEKRKGSE